MPDITAVFTASRTYRHCLHILTCRCALSAYWKDEKSNAEVARLKRKKNTEKRVTINKEKQRKLTAEFRKNGGKVWQDAEAEAYLKKKGANAIALSEDLIALKKQANYK